MANSLWGEEFTISNTIEQDRKIVNKLNNPKDAKSITKVLKSKNLSVSGKLNFITSEVNRILGKYKYTRSLSTV